MRTGPFSDPTVVTLINRYFVPVHIDNLDGSGIRYGMPPGHEDAYMILETPEIMNGPPVESVIFGRIEGMRGRKAAQTTGVLDPQFVKRELVKFLGQHPEYDRTWPTMAELKGAKDSDSVMRYVELLLDEGAVDRVLALLDNQSTSIVNSALLRSRAYRLQGQWSKALAALEGAPAGPDSDLERTRIAYKRGNIERAIPLLDQFIDHHPDHSHASEAFFMRGWLHFQANETDQALVVWRDGIARHPVTESIFSQKAQLTLIRQNWSLDTVAYDESDHEHENELK